MKSRSFTLGAMGRALTFSMWEDLSPMRINKMDVIFGFERSIGFRLSAMERVDTYLLTIGPVGITYSFGYLRED